MNRLYLTFIITLILISPKSILAQKDVTQFLGISVDGFKPEMKKKLIEKGFRINQNNSDILDGEFNGKEVHVHIVTNNNKVYRIMVADVKTLNEADIKIRFNKLIQQFIDNKKYISTSDDKKLKLLLSDEEDISYEMSVKNKRYEAIFFQKTNEYDSLINAIILEKSSLLNKDSIDNKYEEENSPIFKKLIDDKQWSKVVWFMINEFQGEYYISMFYDNKYNQANGEDL
jgi:hypothetical protein